MNPTSHHRRRKLIQPRLQLRLVGAFALVSALALLLQSLLLGLRLSDVATRLPTGGEYLAQAAPALVRDVMLFSFCVLLPVTFAVGVAVTFRVAGPLYRFERHLDAVARGEDVGPCRIREGDQLQELCDSINAALDAARARGAEEARAETGEARETG